MNKQLLLSGGLIVIGVSLLIAILWGWIMVLAIYIGLFFLGLMVLGRYGLLKIYLKTYSLGTILYTHPFSAMLYSMVDSHRSKQSSDLEDFFPAEKRPHPQESEELPPLHFTDASLTDQKATKDDQKG
jgi:hypothetical protein